MSINFNIVHTIRGTQEQWRHNNYLVIGLFTSDVLFNNTLYTIL